MKQAQGYAVTIVQHHFNTILIVRTPGAVTGYGLNYSHIAGADPQGNKRGQP